MRILEGTKWKLVLAPKSQQRADHCQGDGYVKKADVVHVISLVKGSANAPSANLTPTAA